MENNNPTNMNSGNNTYHNHSHRNDIPPIPNDTNINLGHAFQTRPSLHNFWDRNHIQEHARNWRTNFRSVFHEMRPLIESGGAATNPYQTTSILPQQHSFVYRPLTMNRLNDRLTTRLSDQIGTPNDSFVINLDGFNATNAGHSINMRSTEQPSNEHHHTGRAGTADSTSGQPRPNDANREDGLVAEAFANIPEARALFDAFLRYLPYICILLVKTCYDHLDGILDFAALFITFLHANHVVRQEIAKQGQRKLLALLRELGYIVITITIIGFMLEKKNMFISIMFATSLVLPTTLRHLLFSVGITDLVLKLITVGIKILITMLPERIVQYRDRGRIFLFTEAVSQLYRALAPIQPWLIYLLDPYTGSEKLIGVFFSAGYMVAKGGDLLQRVQFLKRAVISLGKRVSFGSQPTKEQIQAVDGPCPICHESFQTPIRLECSHIFCEMCVGKWFDREQTCPLCRAKVADDPSWRDGATTMFVQLY